MTLVVWRSTGLVLGNSFGGMALISNAKTMITDIFASINPQSVRAQSPHPPTPREDAHAGSARPRSCDVGLVAAVGLGGRDGLKDTSAGSQAPLCCRRTYVCV